MNNRYDLITNTFGPFALFILQDNLNGESVSILPEFGGLINSIKLSCGSGLVDILHGYSSAEELTRELACLFKGCSLFPYPNRVNGGRYYFEGREHCLPQNFPQEGNAIHGLVFDKEFRVESLHANNDGCMLELMYVSDGMQGYPFSFEIKQRYGLSEERGLVVTTEIINSSLGVIPVGQGWHPYFSLGTSSIDTLFLKIPGNSIFETDERGIPTKKKLTFSKFSNLEVIGSSSLDCCYEIQTNAPFIDTLLFNKRDNIGLRLRQQTGECGCNYLQVFTPPARDSIALEPMSCAPDAFNNGYGLMHLQRGESLSFVWEVMLMRNSG